MATKKAPTKTTTKKETESAKKKTVSPQTITATPATQKAIKKAHKKITKFVTDISNGAEQVELYFAEISTFIKDYREVSNKH